jgi:hypothetical protein
MAAGVIFRPDSSKSFTVSPADALILAEYLGLPAVAIFALIRLWVVRKKFANACAILISIAVSAALINMDFGEAYWRLYFNKSRYDAIAAQRPGDPLIVFDWGDTSDVVLFFSHTKEYLVIARGEEARKFQQFAGREIDYEERGDVVDILRSLWDEKDRHSRFHEGHFDACTRMRVTRLQESYYYVADFC